MGPPTVTIETLVRLERTRALDASPRRHALPTGSAARLGAATPVRRFALVAGLTLGLLMAGAGSAHPHTVVTQDHAQELANGQNHARFVAGVSCGGDSAAYGLETAHHGPDAGEPGNADGCYRTTGGVAPGQDVENPVIK